MKKASIVRLAGLAALGLSLCLQAEELAPFPKWSEPRAITKGPHEHLFASYFAINSWSPNNRYVTVLETDLNGRLPEPNERCTLGVERGPHVGRVDQLRAPLPHASRLRLRRPRTGRPRERRVARGRRSLGDGPQDGRAQAHPLRRAGTQPHARHPGGSEEARPSPRLLLPHDHPEGQGGLAHLLPRTLGRLVRQEDPQGVALAHDVLHRAQGRHGAAPLLQGRPRTARSCAAASRTAGRARTSTGRPTAARSCSSRPPGTATSRASGRARRGAPWSSPWARRRRCAASARACSTGTGTASTPPTASS